MRQALSIHGSPQLSSSGAQSTTSREGLEVDTLEALNPTRRNSLSVLTRRDLLARGARTLGALSLSARSLSGSSTELDLGGKTDGPLQLNWNENPLGMAPAARLAATRAVDEGHRYPDALRGDLVEAIASLHGVGTDSIVLGNGSTELLQVTTQALASTAPSSRKPALVLAQPTFSIVVRYQQPFGYRVERVPLDSRNAHDLGQMRAKAVGPSLVYICNPNNPTGTLTPSGEIDSWIEASADDVLFLIDEAYVEYVEAETFRSASSWIEKRRNVVVTRTFSKVYGMAGMRFGYALAHPETADWLRGFTPTDNANGPALAAGRASIADDGWLEKCRASNRRAKEITLRCLAELDLETLPSHTNFLMHRVRGSLEVYIGRMRAAGIRVGRPFPPMVSYNRLTLGLPEEMERFARVLQEFRRQDWI